MEREKKFRYSKDHVWIRQENDLIRVGITDYIFVELNEIIRIDMPEINSIIKRSEPFISLESCKAVMDVFTPLSGKIIEINKQIIKNPEIINKDPFDKGWLVIIKADNPEELNKLLSYDDYKNVIG